jgi:hypothetical protein
MARTFLLSIACALLVGTAVGAHADNSTYIWLGKGQWTDAELQAAARHCDGLYGEVKNGAVTPPNIRHACSSKAGATITRRAINSITTPTIRASRAGILRSAGSSDRAVRIFSTDGFAAFIPKPKLGRNQHPQRGGEWFYNLKVSNVPGWNSSSTLSCRGDSPCA